MIKIQTLAIYSLGLIVITGCADIDEYEINAQKCSTEWYALAEKKISTGDSQGHGPHFGSMEWKSVIEFKLGIRDDAQVPLLESEQWCNYIDKHFLK